jgi:hypothetical protein
VGIAVGVGLLFAIGTSIVVVILDSIGLPLYAFARRHPVGMYGWAVAASVGAVMGLIDGSQIRWASLSDSERERWREDG